MLEVGMKELYFTFFKKWTTNYCLFTELLQFLRTSKPQPCDFNGGNAGRKACAVQEGSVALLPTFQLNSARFIG